MCPSTSIYTEVNFKYTFSNYDYSTADDTKKAELTSEENHGDLSDNLYDWQPVASKDTWIQQGKRSRQVTVLAI